MLSMFADLYFFEHFSPFGKKIFRISYEKAPLNIDYKANKKIVPVYHFPIGLIIDVYGIANNYQIIITGY